MSCPHCKNLQITLNHAEEQIRLLTNNLQVEGYRAKHYRNAWQKLAQADLAKENICKCFTCKCPGCDYYANGD